MNRLSPHALRTLSTFVALAAFFGASFASAQSPPPSSPPPAAEEHPSAAPSPRATRSGSRRTRLPTPPPHEGTFEFGSYGRVIAATDLRGGTGRGTNVVAFGPRIVDEESYAELELRREFYFSQH